MVASQTIILWSIAPAGGEQERFSLRAKSPTHLSRERSVPICRPVFSHANAYLSIMRLRSASSFDLRFVYILDESKRVIGNRFPRGFHDNLFHLLFGGSEIQGLCSVVFAGAQELYILCEDDTSPTGSRAAKHCLTNLAPEAMTLMAQAIAGDLDSHQIRFITEEVYRWTGGHAGLSEGLLRTLLSHKSPDLDAVKREVDRFSTEHSELFQLWVSGLTDEGRVVHDVLIDRGRISLDQIAEHLRRKGLGA
jgi:hypothetical protein